MEHKTVALNGANVHYVEAGQGPVVLLLHGLGSSLDSWRCNIRPIASAGFNVLALDLPGNGDSDKPAALNYDARSAVDFTGQFLSALGVEKASLVGNSAGGLVAALFALENPEKTVRLALAAPAGLGRQVSWVLRLMSVPGLGELLFQPWLYKLLRFNKRVFHDPASIPDDVLAEMARVQFLPGSASSTLRSIRSSINVLGLRRPWRVLDRLPQLSAPLMCLWGENDIIIPASHARWIKEAIPRCQVRIFPRCGHWPQMEQADEFNALLTRFLEGGLDNQSGSNAGPVPL